jgi:hypothetical protein
MYSCMSEGMPELKGTLTYRSTSSKTRFLYINEELSVRISRLDVNTARVYFVSNTREIPIPPQITLINGAGEPAARIGESFIIAWVDSYTMYQDGRVLIMVSNQRRQALLGPTELPAGHLAPDGTEIVTPKPVKVDE